jgi:transposase InsO family protein
MDPIRMEIIHAAARELSVSEHGQKGQIIERAARLAGLSVPRTHTLVRQANGLLGLAKPRKRRCDAGETAVTEDDLVKISGAMRVAQRAGKWMLSAGDAIDMLHASGQLSATLSPGRIHAIMHQRGMHPTQLAAPAPAVRMRVEHPNAVWQIDASVCVLYYTPQGEMLLLEEDGVHYKNKLGNYTKVMNELLTRFVGTDPASGCIATRFYTGGETTENALNFLMWMMTQRTSPDGQPMPLHGVPYALYTDQGSCFKSAAFANFCTAMDIKQTRHAPRNSRATGHVENGQNLTERGLESRLRFMDPQTITMASLNDMAELWMHAFNSARVMRRHGMPRYAAWGLITTEQLRIAPPMDIMQALPATMAKTRQVSDDMLVSFAFKGLGSHDYDVRYVPGISPRSQVYVTVNPLAYPAVRVGAVDRDTGEIVWHQVEPVQRNRLGYDVAAPVMGQGYHAMPETTADVWRKKIAAQAYATPDGPATVEQADKARRNKQAPYLGQFDPLADLKAAQVPTYLPRKGVAHAAAAPTVEAARLSVAEACKRLKLELKEAYDAGTYAWLTQSYGSAGVPAEAVQALIAQHRQAGADAPQVGLRSVGGGV